MSSQNNNQVPDWLVYLIMVPIICLIVVLIKYPLYTECRAHGFSKYYCLVGK